MNDLLNETSDAGKTCTDSTNEAETNRQTAKKPETVTVSFAGAYPFYIQKTAEKGRPKAKAYALICRPAGYNHPLLQRQIETLFRTGAAN